MYSCKKQTYADEARFARYRCVPSIPLRSFKKIGDAA